MRDPPLARSPCSLPVSLGVSLEGLRELGIALAASYGALDEIDALSQVGDPGGACDVPFRSRTAWGGGRDSTELSLKGFDSGRQG